MANLSNHLEGGRVFRSNDMFRNRPLQVGYAYYHSNSDSSVSGMRLSFNSDVKGNRNYTVTLSPLDISKIVNRMFNANYNMGFFASPVHNPGCRSDYNYEELLQEQGIKFSTWRYPTTPFANGAERWFWVRAVNRYHAEHQFAKAIKSFTPSLVEEYKEEDNSNG